MDPIDVELPAFDAQFPSNIVACVVPSTGLAVIGLRVPAYPTAQRPLLDQAWAWMETTAHRFSGRPAVMIGDFNVQPNSRSSVGGDHLRRICEDGWRRAQPTGQFSFYGKGNRRSEIDHLLATSQCECRGASYVLDAGGFRLAAAEDALSDHAALMAEVLAAPE